MAVVVAPAVGRVPARLGAAGVVVGAVAVMIIAGLVIPVVHQRPGDERHGTATPLGLVTLIAAGGPAPVLAAVSTDAVGLRQTYPASAQVRTPPTPHSMAWAAASVTETAAVGFSVVNRRSGCACPGRRRHRPRRRMLRHDRPALT